MRKRMHERANSLLETASQYTELRYGVRLRALIGLAAALAAVLAWPILRHFRRRKP